MEGSSSNKQNLLTVSQYTSIIFGSIIGVGILSLPNDVVKATHQDGWISTLIGGIYPLYVVMIARYISKKFPNASILILSKNYFGKFFGSILNFIFATYFIFIAAMIGSYYTNLMGSLMMGFLTPFKIIAILFIIIIYTVSRGLKVIGLISEIGLYITILLLLSPMPALRSGKMLNIYPVFGSGISSIAKGSMKSVFSYAGAEIILLIYPYMKEKNKMLTSSIISVALVIVLYVWCVFITTYYLGPDIVTKSYWPFLLVTQSVTITVVNNYRYVFMILWSLVTFKTCAINCYGSIYILKDFIKSLKIKKIYFLMYPLLVYLTLKYGNEISRQSISEVGTPCYIIFNLLYITVIAILVFIKGGAKT